MEKLGQRKIFTIKGEKKLETKEDNLLFSRYTKHQKIIFKEILLKIAEERKTIYFQENIFYINPKTSYFTCDKQSITWQNVHLLILNKIQKRMSARMKVKKEK